MVWLLGVVIFLLMMATAFMGYVLPWGQMSFWGAQGDHRPVRRDPAGRRADPASGCSAAIAPDNADAQPLLLAPLSAAVRDRRRDHPAHLGAAHSGLDQPDRRRREERSRTPCRSIPITRPRTASALGVFLILSARAGVLPAEHARPPGQLHPGQPALDAGAHRARMVFLAVLRDPARLHRRTSSASRPSCGACWRCSASILLLFFLPWLDKSPVRSGNYRPMFRMFFWILIVDVLVLGYCGGAPAEEPYRDDQPDRDGLLFRALPDHPADHVAGRADRCRCPIRSPRACCTARQAKPRRPTRAAPADA